MNLQAFNTAIDARLRADTGAGGMFAAGVELVTGLFDNFVSPNQHMPYVVYTVASATQSDAFNADIIKIMFYVSVYVSKNGNPTAAAQASAILWRIYGNAMEVSTRVPTYGLHRHPLVVAGGWTGSLLSRFDSQTQHEENYYHFIEVYQTYISRNVVP